MTMAFDYGKYAAIVAAEGMDSASATMLREFTGLSHEALLAKINPKTAAQLAFEKAQADINAALTADVQKTLPKELKAAQCKSISDVVVYLGGLFDLRDIALATIDLAVAELSTKHDLKNLRIKPEKSDAGQWAMSVSVGRGYKKGAGTGTRATYKVAFNGAVTKWSTIAKNAGLDYSGKNVNVAAELVKAANSPLIDWAKVTFTGSAVTQQMTTLGATLVASL
jgi:hypothetical protein